MKVIAEFNEKEFAFLCKPSEVEPLMKALNDLYGIIWCEAFYDPYDEHTKTFAERLVPHIDTVNKILQFKK